MYELCPAEYELTIGEPWTASFLAVTRSGFLPSSYPLLALFLPSSCPLLTFVLGCQSQK